MPELKKILYVEDDTDIQLIVKHALESICNFEVLICSSGAEALSLIADFNPDLLLSDVMMPNIDGLTLLKKIKKQETFKNLPYIFITAKSNTSDITTLINTGALGVIFKPFNPVDLGNDIQEMWHEYNVENKSTAPQ